MHLNKGGVSLKLYYEQKPGELEHGLFKKLFKPKYLKKIPLGNGKHRYIYSQEELDAYNKEAAIRRQNAEQARQGNIAAKRNSAYIEKRKSEPRVRELKAEQKEYQEEYDKRIEKLYKIDKLLKNSQKLTAEQIQKLRKLYKDSFDEAESFKSKMEYPKEDLEEEYARQKNLTDDIMRGTSAHESKWGTYNYYKGDEYLKRQREKFDKRVEKANEPTTKHRIYDEVMKDIAKYASKKTNEKVAKKATKK